jgi:hypothetical protein
MEMNQHFILIWQVGRVPIHQIRMSLRIQSRAECKCHERIQNLRLNKS